MERFPASDGAMLAYDDLGPRGGIPILFLHEWQGVAATWAPVRAALDARHRTIALDLRGFGESNEAPGPYTIDAFANDLSDLLAFLDLDPLVVVGHAMGAAVAQRFAIDRPDAVEALVLVAPVPASGVRFAPSVDAFLRSTATDPLAANAWLGSLVHGDVPREAMALLRAAAAATPPQVALESYESWSTLSFEDEARTIATPTLVIAPAHGRPLTPAFVRERVADVIDDSELQVLADAAHYAPLEQPARIARAIETFVDEL